MSVQALESLLASDNLEQVSARVKIAADIELPELKCWNYAPCRKHRRWETPEGVVRQNVPKPGCRDCGLHPRKHQRVGATWLYLQKKALLADSCGTGKTAHLGLLIAMMQETLEIHSQARVVLVCRSAAVYQHVAELRRMLPMAHVAAAVGAKRKRMETYVSGWDVLVIGQHMFLRDVDILMQFSLALLAIDDVDALRTRSSKTAWAIKRVAARTPRCVVMTGTPLQKKLHELYSVLEPLGGRTVFGSEAAFMRRYVKTENMVVWTNTGRRMTIPKVVGYQNVRECADKLQPFALRRTAADIEDVDLPAVISSNVYLELTPAQRSRYDELKEGVIQIVSDEGVQVKQATALSKIHYGAKICTGLAALGEDDTPGTSVKLDWVMDKVGPDGDLGSEKVVIFLGYKTSIRALQARLDAVGVGYVTIWGDEPDKAKRAEAIEKFWTDPSCRVLLGTQAIEQSLNLQVANHLINVDMILNPARMEQLAGRIRRDGSAHTSVYVHNLLTLDTQEERYIPLLEREQALIDTVWDESSELFESLSPLALLTLISG